MNKKKDYSPSSLFCKWSKIKSIFKVRKNVEPTNYASVKLWLKQNAKGMNPKQSSVFTREDIDKYDFRETCTDF